MATRQDFIPINQKLESSYNAQLLTELVYSYFYLNGYTSRFHPHAQTQKLEPSLTEL